MLQRNNKAEKIHDRMTADLPINSVVSISIVPDPYSNTGEKIKVLRSIRDDPLASMYHHGRINDAQLEAGRKWQKLHELSTIGAISAIDPTKEAVDGGQLRDPITDHQIKAFRALADAYKELGAFGGRLIFDVLADGMTLAKAAASRGLNGQRATLYVGRRFIECLETLAVHWGFAGEKRP